MLLRSLRLSLIGLTPLVLLGCGQPSKTVAPRPGSFAIPPGQRSTVAIEEVQARIESVSGSDRPIPKTEFPQLFAEFSDFLHTRQLSEQHRYLAVRVIGDLRPFAPARGELLTLSEQYLKDADSPYGAQRESFDAPLRGLVWHMDSQPTSREERCFTSYLRSREPAARELACHLVGYGLLPRFRERVLEVYAVEPTEEVRQAAEYSFGGEYDPRLTKVLQDLGKSRNQEAAAGAQRMLRRLIASGRNSRVSRPKRG